MGKLSKIKKETSTQRKRRLMKRRKERRENLQKIVISHKRFMKPRNKCPGKVMKNPQVLKETTTQRRRRLNIKKRKRQEQNPEPHTCKRRKTENKKLRDSRANENEDQHITRLIKDALKHANKRSSQTNMEHDGRLGSKRAQCDSFHAYVNKFADQSCEICQKRCYPNQIVKNSQISQKDYLPLKLITKKNLMVCFRCDAHLRSSKAYPPSKAYWNNLLPGDIPQEIASLTESERRLLQRIIPYVKVVKYPGRFGQYGFQGHAVLFALDIFEVSDKITDLLPRSSDDLGIVVITESLENLNISKEYNISSSRVYKALDWLLINNPLYKDVKINRCARLNTQDVIRVIPKDTGVNCGISNGFKPMSDISRILRASWNQANQEVFQSRFAGQQCFAMVVANIIRASILPPGRWDRNVLDQNMIEGDALYARIYFETKNSLGAFPIDNRGFLEIKNLDVVKSDLLMFQGGFSIEYDDINRSFNGSLCDRENDGINFQNLDSAITTLFAQDVYGILVVCGGAYGLLKQDQKFYFTDSHSCGPEGKRGAQNGKACVIECDNMEELIRIIRRTVSSTSGTQFCINAVRIIVKDRDKLLQQHVQDDEQASRCNIPRSTNTQTTIRQIPTLKERPEPKVVYDNYGLYGFKPINDISRILRASWNQADQEIFQSRFAGQQCFAMVVANIIRASTLPPSQWYTNVLNQNMIEGDALYARIVWETENNLGTFPIDSRGFLEIKNLDVVKSDLLMFEGGFSIEYDDINRSFNGSLCDRENDGINFQNLDSAITTLFAEDIYGILVVSGGAYGLLKQDQKFYFTDSHSCGPKGKGGARDGKACVIECDNMEELIRIIRRTVSSTSGTQFCINAVRVSAKDRVLSMRQYLEEYSSSHTIEHEPLSNNTSQFVPVTTSVMAPIDHAQPDISDEFEESRQICNIVRKTKDNIVNVNRELKAEEFCWFNLFPFGKNGLNEQRPVKITPLDYFQQRILGSDTRFQRTDYLFYALSMFEYFRVQSTINACGRTIQGQEGAVEDLHLHLKNLRGSASYWRTAHNELIAFIRCLGPPTWFITLSCNDLNWSDMRKALLIADGRPDDDPSKLSIDETQRLIESYPVVLSRHFSGRVDAFMKEIRRDDTILGGKVIDFWTRIEFQNRGSPHVHLVVWVENAPSFETPEGLAYIDEVITCKFPKEDEDKDLNELVKRNQIHRHTHTCNKNNSGGCRFAFPRKPCKKTCIVPSSSDEFIRNGGRFCSLKRTKNEKWVNNYNQKILEFWNGNMDIQPCGTNESIAHYIAKYISKTEPTNVNMELAQAIRKIRREETNISKKLFKSCMRILKERQVSAAECVYRLCHLPLRSSSRQCVFLNTRKPNERYQVLRFENNQAVGLCSNMFERYIHRPKEAAHGFDFPNLCLLEFAMYFEPFYAKRSGHEEESIDSENVDTETKRRLLKLTNNTKMVIRNIPAVVRVPFFQMSKDPENYYYSLLAQYLPFYSENELIDEFNSAREAFLAREDQLRQNSSVLELHRLRDKELETAFKQAHAFNLLEFPEDMPENLEDEVIEEVMPNEQFENICNALNLQQRELFRYITRSIYDQIKGSSLRVRMFVTGGAGVGKTFTFNALKEQVNRCYGKISVKVGALTGVAARLVGGTTLHTLFKLPVEKDGKMIITLPPLTGNYLKVLRNSWNDIEFLFIDEISMVPYEMFTMIDSRLRQLKKQEDKPFGGINIVVFGDLFQLPPIRGSEIFKQPARFLPATNLWRLFSLLELSENMRQKGDTTFTDLLNDLRVGELKAQHLNLLMSKMLTDPSGDFDCDKAIRICPTRSQVDKHNQQVLERYRKKGIKIFRVKAQDVLLNTNRNSNNINIDNIVSDDVNKTGGLQKILEIFINCRVMLRSNVNIEKGLVNGAMGIVKEIVWPLFRRDQMYECDIPSVRIDFGRDGVHLIKPITIQFPALRNYGTIERTQLPIILCWACTVHKMQGCTVDHAVVYLGPELFAKGQAYVALSRVKSLEGLKIEQLDCTKLTGKKPCNTNALEEMERMRSLPSPRQFDEMFY